MWSPGTGGSRDGVGPAPEPCGHERTSQAEEIRTSQEGQWGWLWGLRPCALCHLTNLFQVPEDTDDSIKRVKYLPEL